MNPTITFGPITARAAERVQKFRLVTLGTDGVSHAAASDTVYGAVTENAAPPAEGDELLLTNTPELVAVHLAGVVPLEFDGDAGDFTAGTVVYAAADGKIAASGSTPVGIVTADAGATRARVHLRLSAGATGASESP